MARRVHTLVYKVNGRLVEVKAYDSVGVEDAYDVLCRAAMHRIATGGEDLYEPTPREVKDWIIKSGRYI